MFGSKIRSWMENHIGRPKKNRNKNKNGNSSNLVSANAQNGHKGNSYQNSDGTTIATTTTMANTQMAMGGGGGVGSGGGGSPARRSEVSPIQNHTTSRVGWQSPDNNTPMSPKSDHYPYHHMVKSKTSPKIVQRKSSYSIEHTIIPSTSTPSTIPYDRPPSYQYFYPKSINSMEQHQQSSSQTILNSNTSSGLNQSGNASNTYSQKNGKLSDNRIINHQSSSSPSPSLLKNAKSIEKSKHCSNNNTSSSSNGSGNNNSNIKNNNNLCSANPLDGYDMSEIRFVNGNSNSKNNNNNNTVNRPASVSESKYGKILTTPSSASNNRLNSCDKINSNNQISFSSRNNENNNNNHHALNNHSNNNGKNHNINNNVNNNNNNFPNYHQPTPPPPQSIVHHHHHHHHAAQQQSVAQIIDPASSSTSSSSVVTACMLNGQNANILMKSSHTMGHHRNENGAKCAAINRTNRYSNCSTLSAPGSHPMSHMINSLSSPESAYSTGYSTDGTSPGGNSYTPEYYINIRTGTHYFPKVPIGTCAPNTIISSNSIDIANRLKFGLNKIDEARQETDVISHYHRRTESFDLGKNCQSMVSSGAKILQSNGIMSPVLLSKNQQYQNIKAIESPSPRQRCRIRTNPWFSNTDTSSSSLSSFPANHKSNQSANKSNNNKTNDGDSASTTSSGIRSSNEFENFNNNNKSKSMKSNKNLPTDSDSSSTSTSTEKEDFSIKTFSPNTIRRRKTTTMTTTEIVKIETKEIHKTIQVTSSSSTTSAGLMSTQSKQQLPSLPGNTGRVAAIVNKEEHSIKQISSSQQESDDDATLNEMMGKYDESYVYEKETDILSDDSEQTDCPSDLDTGQDAEDECDTDELLDIDYIDTGSIQEIVEKDVFRNTGSCSYHPVEIKRSTKSRRSRKQNLDQDSSKRRKKLIRRKKSSEQNHSSPVRNGNPALINNSPFIRGCRSAGGTPVSLRKNKSQEDKKQQHMSPLTNRSNSLTLTEVHSIRSRVLAIAESEKALLKADLEADVKYKQLIHEAETILVSLKSNNSTNSPNINTRETPVASPNRRICNLPANKRVEMLRNCEVDLKRELAKTCNAMPKFPPPPPLPPNDERSENFILNKRLEILKYESSSAPNSPKSCRFSPRKTHITNFISANAEPVEMVRRKSVPDPNPVGAPHPLLTTAQALMSPKLQLNGRKLLTPPQSPTPVRRRFRSHSPNKTYIELNDSSESDREYNEMQAAKAKARLTKLKPKNSNDTNNNNCSSNNNKENKKIYNLLNQCKASEDTSSRCIIETDLNNKNYLIENINRKTINNNITNNNYGDDKINDNFYINNNPNDNNTTDDNDNTPKKQPLMSFRSIDIGQQHSDITYCPQSEPLKRKIYTCSSTFDKLQKSLDIESEIPKKALLDKINQLRSQRRATKTNKLADGGLTPQQSASTNQHQQQITTYTDDNDNEHIINNYENDYGDNSSNSNNNNNLSNNNNINTTAINNNKTDKRQLILDTIEDLKRSLEDQSVELYGLNDPDE